MSSGSVVTILGHQPALWSGNRQNARSSQLSFVIASCTIFISTILIKCWSGLLYYTVPCYVLKMDVSGYFMHIERQRLCDITLGQLHRMAAHRITLGKVVRWRDCVDMSFVEYLTRVIILQDPCKDCYRRGTMLDWYALPRRKSLFFSDEGCGLPIGNLTSQLFSNVYLNELDQYVKRELKVRHYGRYVDDFYLVSTDCKWLLDMRRPIKEFLSTRLGLTVNDSKTCVCDVRMGVTFLGAYLKPYRRYVSNTTLRRIKDKLPGLASVESPDKLRSRLNSFLGVLSHYRSYRISRQIFYHLPYIYRFGHFLKGMRKFVIDKKGKRWMSKLTRSNGAHGEKHFVNTLGQLPVHLGSRYSRRDDADF